MGQVPCLSPRTAAHTPHARTLYAKPGTDKTKVYLTVLFGYL